MSHKINSSTFVNPHLPKLKKILPIKEATFVHVISLSADISPLTQKTFRSVTKKTL